MLASLGLHPSMRQHAPGVDLFGFPSLRPGYVGRQLGEPGMVRAIRVGEAGVREVAAYLLDHDHFSRVPRTALASLSHPLCCFHVAAPVAAKPAAGASSAKGSAPAPPARQHFLSVKKLASVQAYVKHDHDASEHGTSRFPPSEVHRLGLLDLRLYNTDRHTGNILVRKVRTGDEGLGIARG